MNKLKPLHTAITTGLLVIGLSACTTTAPYQPPVTSFDFNTCQKQALVKDRAAVRVKLPLCITKLLVTLLTVSTWLTTKRTSAIF